MKYHGIYYQKRSHLQLVVYWGGIDSGSRGVLGEKGEGEVVGIKKDCWGLIVYCKGLGPDVVVSSCQ